MRRPGTDKRGNAERRRRNKYWMLETFGNGRTCPCTHCGKRLNFQTVEADRKVPGGSYRRDNIQPSCGMCNKVRSNNVTWIHPLNAQVAR